MAGQIFIDTGAWVAMVDRSDTFHPAASEFSIRRMRRWPVWVTTNLVVAESYVSIYRRGGYVTATRFLKDLQNSRKLLRIYSDPIIEAQAEAILRQYADQDFSYVDAVSFAVMRQRGIGEAFAFDHHFTTAGFTRVV